MQPQYLVGRYIRTSNRKARIGLLAPPAYDYLITNDAEWTTVFANTDATLSGKTIAINGPLTAKTLSSRSWASRPTLLGLGSDSIPNIGLANVAGLRCQNLRFRMTGWPRASQSMVSFSSGTFGNIEFDGCSFRHGYGAGLVNFNRTTEYPEYTRVANVTNATTTSSRITLTFQDPAVTDAWVEFFNRGTQTVYFRLGNSAVVATAGDTAVPAGTRVRSASFNPQTNTHIAVLSASGTQEVNARTEIGFPFYLADAFNSSGSTTITDLTIKSCTFEDVSNAIKQFPTTINGTVVVMDNVIRRAYQDIAAGLMTAETDAFYFLRNVMEMPFARSGINENENGDARDPHGDLLQLFWTQNNATLGPVYSGGNVMLRPASRTGAGGQGMFLSTNTFSPSYDNIYSIADIWAGGAARGISIGQPVGQARRVFIFGCTVFDAGNVANTNAGILTNATADAEHVVMNTLASNISVESGPAAIQSGNATLNTAAIPANVFPNLVNLPTATDRSTALTAYTSAAEGLGIGAQANQSAIDFGASDPTQVINWANIPSGVAWTNQTDVALSTVVTLPLRRILNIRASQTVTVGAGTEWRSVGTDKTTEVQAWTSSPGTIQPNQYIQIRRTSSASNNTTVSASVTINGFTTSVNLTTVPAFVARSVNFPGTAHYTNASVTGLTGSSQGTLSLWFRNTAGAWAFGANLLDIRNAGGTSLLGINTQSTGRMRFLLLQDGSGTDQWDTPNSTFVINQWYHVLWSWNWALSRFQLYVNNVALSPVYSFAGATKFDLDGQGLTRHGIAATSAGAGIYTGDLAHFYINFASSLDLTVQANREKFALAGAPVNLGDDGSLPTGVQPAYYWDGVPPTFNNKGSVVSGTLTGTITASTAPSY